LIRLRLSQPRLDSSFSAQRANCLRAQCNQTLTRGVISDAIAGTQLTGKHPNGTVILLKGVLALVFDKSAHSLRVYTGAVKRHWCRQLHGCAQSHKRSSAKGVYNHPCRRSTAIGRQIHFATRKNVAPQNAALASVRLEHERDGQTSSKCRKNAINRFSNTNFTV
jgi:hypothetical protein